MFALLPTSLVRGVVQTSLIMVISAFVGATTAWSMMHNSGPAALSSSHQIAPIDPTCTSSLPCIEYDNNSSGPGARGVSLHGSGLNGQTKFNSTSNANGKSGVLGQDLSSSGTFDAGVTGTSKNGFGIVGVSTNNDAVRALSSNGPGIGANSNNSYGVFASTENTSGGVAGVQGNDESTGHLDAGVKGTSINGIGVQGVSLGGGTGIYASSASGVGLNVVGGTVSNPTLSVIAGPTGFNVIAACSSGVSVCTSPVFTVTVNGGVFGAGFEANGDIFSDNGSFAIQNTTGEYYKDGTCVAGCSASAKSVRRVRTYAPQASRPTIEDYGEAHLVGGQAYVRLDPAFANVIDQRTNYLVVVTPEGDSNGLYVAQRTLAGFMVRENRGGKSTLAFAYRIATKPYASTAARLPMVDVAVRPVRSLPGRTSPWPGDSVRVGL
jgi:hypothetical protein